MLYAVGYGQVDESPVAHLVKDELQEHQRQLKSFKNRLTDVQDNIAQIVEYVSHIYVPNSYADFKGKMGTTEDSVEDMQRIVSDLLSNWEAYENTNYYENVGTLLSAVDAAMSRFQGKTLTATTSYEASSFGTLNAEMLFYVDEMNQVHRQYAADFKDAWQEIGETNDAIDEMERKQREEAEKSFWITLGLTALVVVATVATGGLAGPVAITLFAIDMAFTANTLISTGSLAFAGKEFNPMVEGLQLTGMDDKTAAKVVDVASMATMVIGGVQGGAKVLGKGVQLYKAIPWLRV